MIERTRTRMLNVRVADLEMTMLQQLAEEIGLSVSDVVRQLIRKAHSEAGLARAKPRRKKS
jgi:antitoxin component of RelBE/YafQ-DinJ toxin-antitoxin module